MNKEQEKIYRKLIEKNEELRGELDQIFDDLNITDSYDDIWERINLLIENELKQGDLKNEE